MADGPNLGTVLDIMQRDSSATGATAAFLPRAIPASCTPCGSALRSTDDRRICRRRRTARPRRRRRPASGNDAGAGRTERPDRRWFPGADRRTWAVSVVYAKQSLLSVKIRCVARKSMGDRVIPTGFTWRAMRRNAVKVRDDETGRIVVWPRRYA
jgi:hypothetical protein